MTWPARTGTGDTPANYSWPHFLIAPFAEFPLATATFSLYLLAMQASLRGWYVASSSVMVRSAHVRPSFADYGNHSDCIWKCAIAFSYKDRLNFIIIYNEMSSGGQNNITGN